MAHADFSALCIKKTQIESFNNWIFEKSFPSKLASWKIKCQLFFQVKYYRDTYAEHPEDRENIEYCVQMEGEDALLTLNGLYDQMKSLGFDLSYFR